MTISWGSWYLPENLFQSRPLPFGSAFHTWASPGSDAHSLGVPQANPSLVRPEQWCSLRTHCWDGATHSTEIPSQASAASLGASLGPARRRGTAGGAAESSSLLPPGHSSWALPAAREGKVYECHGSLAKAAGLIPSAGIPARWDVCMCLWCITALAVTSNNTSQSDKIRLG